MPEEPLATFTGRYPVAMLERLDRVAEAMSTAAGGIKVTRSDVIRAAIEAGLPALEQRFGLTAQPAPPKGGKKRPGKA